MKPYSTSLNAPLMSSNTEIDWDGPSWKERTFSHPERTVRIGTAFSGIGSPEMALKELGVKHELVFACDIDKAAKKTYFANYPIKEKNWYDDIQNFDASGYKGKIDLFVAGVCCQPWSIAGKQDGLKDERGQLFKDFVRVICECQPKVWIFENVDNIINHKDEYDGVKQRSWPLLINLLNREFEKAGLNYQLKWRVLNSADYGVPQSRKRVFMIGFQKPTDFLFPSPIKLEKSLYDYLDDKTHVMRTLSPRERIRLMGFPDSFKQVVTDNQFSHQAGNSIVVDVMKALYKQMDITKYGIRN